MPLVLEPTTRHWTRAEYYQMAEMGLFNGQRVELIGGEVVVMSPQQHPHYFTLDRIGLKLHRALGDGFWVRTQGPLALLPNSEPEPDVAVVKGRAEDFTDHPATAILIVEVSLTTLVYDRGRKASLYASVGIADYWIVNLADRELEVLRAPVADATQPFGFRYSQLTVLGVKDSVMPLAAPQVSIAVADLLPRA